MEAPDFWGDRAAAQALVGKLRGIKGLIEPFLALERELRDLRELAELAGNADAVIEARAAAEWGLRRILELLDERQPLTVADAAHLEFTAADISRFLARSETAPGRGQDPRLPLGTPIGAH